MKIRLLSNSSCYCHHSIRAKQQLGNWTLTRLIASPHTNQRVLAHFIVGQQSMLIACAR